MKFQTKYIFGEVVMLVLAVLTIVSTILVLATPIIKQQVSNWVNKHQHYNVTVFNELEKEVKIDIPELNYTNVIVSQNSEVGIPDSLEDAVQYGAPLTLKVVDSDNNTTKCTSSLAGNIKFTIKSWKGTLNCSASAV